MAGVLQTLQQLQTGHPRQVGINHQAFLAARTIGFEECLTGRIGLDGPAILLEHRTNRFAHMLVVVDDKNDGWSGPPGHVDGVRIAHVCRGSRRS